MKTRKHRPRQDTSKPGAPSNEDTEIYEGTASQAEGERQPARRPEDQADGASHESPDTHPTDEEKPG